MPGSNVFPNPKAIVTASDRIAAKRDTTIYKELEENVVHHNTIATNKKVKITINNNTIEAYGFNAMLEENQIKFRASNVPSSMQ